MDGINDLFEGLLASVSAMTIFTVTQPLIIKYGLTKYPLYLFVVAVLVFWQRKWISNKIVGVVNRQ